MQNLRTTVIFYDKINKIFVQKIDIELNNQNENSIKNNYAKLSIKIIEDFNMDKI